MCTFTSGSMDAPPTRFQRLLQVVLISPEAALLALELGMLQEQAPGFVTKARQEPHRELGRPPS